MGTEQKNSHKYKEKNCFFAPSPKTGKTGKTEKDKKNRKKEKTEEKRKKGKNGGEKMDSYILPIVSIIIGTIISFLILKNYKTLERIGYVITAEVVSFALCNFLLNFIALLISSAFNPGVDYNIMFAIGGLEGFIILAPCYSYCINKYSKNKKKGSFIASAIIASAIYIVILVIISLFL